MNLSKVKPVLTCEINPGRSDKYFLHIEGDLTCPCCKRTEPTQWPKIIIDYVGESYFYNLAHLQSNEVCGILECTECGVLFRPVPRNIDWDFRKKMYTLITESWFKKELAQQKKQSSKKVVVTA